jgi:hypothetical protein
MRALDMRKSASDGQVRSRSAVLITRPQGAGGATSLKRGLRDSDPAGESRKGSEDRLQPKRVFSSVEWVMKLISKQKRRPPPSSCKETGTCQCELPLLGPIQCHSMQEAHMVTLVPKDAQRADLKRVECAAYLVLVLPLTRAWGSPDERLSVGLGHRACITTIASCL